MILKWMSLMRSLILFKAAGGTAELITGYGTDPSLGDNVSVTIIANKINSKINSGYMKHQLLQNVKLFV